MPLRAVTVLCAILGSASGLRLGLIRPACVRASAVRLAVEPVETPKDCVAAAETGAEAAECLVPIAGKQAQARAKATRRACQRSQRPTSSAARIRYAPRSQTLQQSRTTPW